MEVDIEHSKPSVEISETLPRGKIAIIDLQPLTKQNNRIAEESFRMQRSSIKEYSNLEIFSIKAPKPSETNSTSEREERATLSLPESIDDYKGIIITGSPFAAYPRDKEGKPFVAQWKYDVIKLLRAAKDKKIRVLGICAGCQILAEAFGGRAVDMQTRQGEKVEEIGWGDIRRSPDGYGDPVMEGIEDEFIAPEHHGDVVAKVPEGAVVLAENEYGVQAFRIDDGDWHAWAFQFHAERNPKKVEEQLDALLKKGLGKGEIDAKKAKGKGYTGSVKRIFNNFLRAAWSQNQ